MKILAGLRVLQVGTCLLLLCTSSMAFSSKLVVDRRISDEIQTTGGTSLGLGHGGSALITDISAVRLNPANLAIQKHYTLSGAYHWPTFGRPFYQGGIVDSHTSGFAAGLSYTGFSEEYRYDPRSKEGDSLMRRRVAIGVAQIIGRVALGLNLQHVDGYKLDLENSLAADPVKGITFGLGISGLITPNIRFGVSGENLSNRDVEHLAPRVIRVGLAYFLHNNAVSAHLDYTNRQRIAGTEYEMAIPQVGMRADSVEELALVEQVRRDDQKYAKPEQMLVGSLSVQIYDMIRLLGAYGREVENKRQTLAGGLAVVNGPTTVAFTAARPYLDRSSSQQSFSVGIGLSM